jgi:hypothetical protein
MKSIEVQLNEALELVKAKDAEIATLKESVNKQQKATAKAERATQLKESKLPEPCIVRIDAAFANSTDNAGLKEAINVEAEYVKSLRGTTTKHNGVNDNGGAANLNEAEQEQAKAEGFKERQFNTYRSTGMSVAEASAMSGFTPKK